MSPFIQWSPCRCLQRVTYALLEWCLLPGCRCLQDHLDDEDMSQECKAEVAQDQIRSNQDFRLNFRLSKACKKDIAALCIHECSTYLGQACGGKVSTPLTSRSVYALHPCHLAGQWLQPCSRPACECRHLYSGYQNSLPPGRPGLQLAKTKQQQLWLSNSQAASGRGSCCRRCHKSWPSPLLQVLRCLTEKQEEIEDTDCKNEVFQFEKMEVADMRNDAPMAVACKADLEQYCKGVKPGEEGWLGS